ncbi:hypothetical protein GCM10010417_50750 [Streptomyces carpaticus]
MFGEVVVEVPGRGRDRVQFFRADVQVRLIGHGLAVLPRAGVMYPMSKPNNAVGDRSGGLVGFSAWVLM